MNLKLTASHSVRIIKNDHLNKSSSAIAKALAFGLVAILASGCVSQQAALNIDGSTAPQNIAVQPENSLASFADSSVVSSADGSPALASSIPIKAPRGISAPAQSVAAADPSAATSAQIASQSATGAQISNNAAGTGPAGTDPVAAVRPVQQVTNAPSNELAIAQPAGNTPASNVIESKVTYTQISSVAPVVNAATTTPTNPAVATQLQTDTQLLTDTQVPASTAVPVPKPVQDTARATAQPVQVASVSSAPQPVQTVTSVEIETPQTTKAAKQPNFFERLFGGAPATATTKNTQTSRSTRSGEAISPSRDVPSSKRQKQTKTEIRTVSTSASAGSGDLPGVKPSKDLFGIKEEVPQATVTRVASAGSLGRLSPNGLRLQHSKVQVACLKPGVLRILNIVEKHYGKKPIITSGYRSPNANRRAGGARNSQHIFCKAVDIQVEGVSKWKLAQFIRTIPGRGGVGTYCRTKSVHFDTGSVRDWHHPCRKSSKRKRKK